MTNKIQMAFETAENKRNTAAMTELTESDTTVTSSPENNDKPEDNDNIRSQINEATKARDTAINNINKAKDSAKHLQSEIDVLKEFGQDTSETETKLTNTVGQIANFKAEAEKFQQVIDHLNYELRRHYAESQQNEEANIGQEMVSQIQLPFETEENPRLYATIIGNMASAIQNNLIWGEDYLQRLKMRRDRPDHNTANGDHGSLYDDGNNDLTNQIEAIEQERSFMRSMMFALKAHYDKAYSHRDRGATNFPRFLFRTNDEVRKKAEEYAARRQQEWVEQQRKLKAEGKQFYTEMDTLTMPNF